MSSAGLAGLRPPTPAEMQTVAVRRSMLELRLEIWTARLDAGHPDGERAVADLRERLLALDAD